MENKESKRGQKLYYYLSRLSTKELKDFHAYLSSPLLGNSPQMARMLLVIESDVLAVGGRVIDADLFQAEFFPGQALDEGKRKYIRIRLVQMLDRLLDFVAFMEYKGDTNAQDVSLLKAMFTRGWEKYFERTYQEIEAKPAKKDFGEYHLYRMRREIVRNELLTKKAASIEDSNLTETIEKIEANSILNALKYAAASLIGEIAGGAEVKNRFADLALECAAEEPFCDHIEIKAYGIAYKILRQQKRGETIEKSDFVQLKQILIDAKIEDPTEAPDLFKIAHGFCFHAIAAHQQTDYIPEMQELFQHALSHNALIPNGKIDKTLYSIIIKRMCRIGETEWAKKFLEDWKDRIIDDKDRTTYLVSSSFLHLQLREYDKVIEKLHPHIGMIEERILGMNARLHFCQALWFLEDYQWLIFQIQAFRQFVLRNYKNNNSQKSIHIRYLEIFHKMCLAKVGNPDLVLSKLVKLRESMERNEETNRYFWLYRALSSTIAKIEA